MKLAILGTCVATLLGGLVVATLGRGGAASTPGVRIAADPGAIEEPIARPRTAPPRSVRPPAPAVDVQRDVAVVIERELPSLRTTADVDAYLDTLEDRARARGTVSAVDVAPGFAAIERLGLDPEATEERRAAYDARLRALQHELDNH